jgi:hypothetical protein
MPLKKTRFEDLENGLKLSNNFTYCVNPADYISITGELLQNKNLFSDIDRIRKNYNLTRTISIEEKPRLIHYASLLNNYKDIKAEKNYENLLPGVLKDYETYRYFYKETGASLKFNPLSGSPAGLHVLEKILELLNTHINLIHPKALFKTVNVRPDEGGLHVDGTDIYFNNSKLRIFTSHSSTRYEEINPSDLLAENVIIYIVSIGPGIDDEVKILTKKGEMFEAYLLNGIGAGAAEMTANDLNRYMNDHNKKNDYTYDRLSPGYGAWNVSEQTKIFRLLEPEKHIGVTLTDSHIMLPEKSTSGIMGLTLKEITI